MKRVKAVLTHGTTKSVARVVLSILVTGAFEMYKKHNGRAK